MIKKLRIKFVCVMMAIVIIALGAILGVVIHFGKKNMETQSISMMRTIASDPFLTEHGDAPPGEVRLQFFVVKTDHRGKILSAGSGRYDISEEEDLERIVDKVLSSRRESGVLRKYDLRYFRAASPGGYKIVFADIRAEAEAMGHMVLSSVLTFAGAVLLFLCISILLSHWAIKPVEKAWMQQRQFVADASHELKTPLSVIMANAELLQNTGSSPEDRGKFSRNILTTSYQMRTLVENMLEMARVDNGTQSMHFAAVDFSQLVTDAVLSFQLLYEERAMALQSSIQEDISLQGSEQHLYQVLDVLLDNALKYGTPQSTVQVKLEAGGRSCTLSVASAGDALSPEDLKNIFKRFYRVDKARTRNGSYGLGLPIAESIVTAHRGRIWAQSKNGRNTFYVQLPVQ